APVAVLPPLTGATVGTTHSSTTTSSTAPTQPAPGPVVISSAVNVNPTPPEAVVPASNPTASPSTTLVALGRTGGTYTRSAHASHHHRPARHVHVLHHPGHPGTALPKTT